MNFFMLISLFETIRCLSYKVSQLWIDCRWLFVHDDRKQLTFLLYGVFFSLWTFDMFPLGNML